MKYSIIPAILCVLLSACGGSKAKEKPAATAGPKSNSIRLSASQKQGLKADTVKMMPDEELLTVPGEISFDEDHVIRIFPIVSGTVDRIYVSLGDYVQKGQLLAILSSTDINSYQSEFILAENNKDLAEKNFNRVKKLYDSGFASGKELEEASSDLNNATQTYLAQKRQLSLYGAGAHENDAVFKVTAPISGYLVERNVNEGTQIRTDNSQSMLTISDLKDVWVLANVYESDMSRIHVGDMAEIVTVAYPDKVLSGSVTKINTVLDPEARTVKARIELKNEGDLLRPEMFATVTLRPVNVNRSLHVPTQAIFIENGRNYVIKAEGDMYVKTEIKQGRTGKNYTQVLDGVRAGDIILSQGALFVASAINNQ